MLINAANLQSLFKGFQTSFNKAFDAADPKWEAIATRVPSTGKSETYGWLGQFPNLREWLGDRQIKNLVTHGYEIKNRKFEGTISVSRDDIEDDSYGVLGPLFEEQGRASAVHPDSLVFDLMKNGFANLCYDGQYFFDTDHPVGKEDTGITSVSNVQAGAGSPWFLLDTSRPLKPFIFQVRRDYDLKAMTDESDEHVFMRDEYRYGVDARVNAGYAFWQMAYGSKDALDATNFQAMYDAMMAFKNDEGRPLNIQPNLLVCGPSNRSAALSVIGMERNADGSSNVNYKATDLMVTAWLS